MTTYDTEINPIGRIGLEIIERGGEMKLTEKLIEALKDAALEIGEYGKVTLAASGGVVDIITENRTRIQNGRHDPTVLQGDIRGGEHGETI